MTAVMAGPDPLDPTSLPGLGTDLAAAGQATGDLRGLRIAYSEDLGYLRVDPGVRQAFRAAVERFRELGAEMEQAEPDLANPIDTWNTIACVDNLVSEGPLLDTGLVAADTRELIEAGSAYSASDYVRARNEQGAYAAAFGPLHGALRPVPDAGDGGGRVPARHHRPGRAIEGQPIGEHFDDWCHFCYPANLTGRAGDQRARWAAPRTACRSGCS